MSKNAFLDTQAIAADFEVGDLVHYVTALKMTKIPYPGTVIAVHKDIGFVDVRFSWGEERVSPELLVKASGKSAASRVASAYQSRIGHLLHTAHFFADAGVSEMDAYDKISKRYTSSYTDGVIQMAVSSAFDENSKTAMYWKQKGRQYVPSQQELDTGCFNCPRCKTELEQAIYKKWTKLYACKECLFLIKQDDILDSLDAETRKEVEKSLGWTPSVNDPAKAFEDLL